MVSTSLPMPRLDGLPDEVFEKIVEILELSSIKTLRFTSKTVNVKCCGPHFLGFYRHQSTNLQPADLARLASLARHPIFGPAVEVLAIITTVYDTSVAERELLGKTRSVTEQEGVFTTITQHRLSEDDLKAVQADVDWLRAQIQKQAAARPEDTVEQLAQAMRGFGALDTIDLVAVVTQGRGKLSSTQTGQWPRIWERASETYRTVTSAIARSGIALETLLCYRNTPRCSIQSAHVNAHIPSLLADGFASGTARTIKNVAIRISPPVRPDWEAAEAQAPPLQGAEVAYRRAMGSAYLTTRAPLYAADDPALAAEENFPGVARMLALMPNLEAVDLHMHHAVRDGRAAEYVRVFAAVAREVRLPRLEQVLLRGVVVTQGSLLAFLKNHPGIDDLHLEEVSMNDEAGGPAGSWAPVFEYMSCNMRLRKLHLENLWTSGRRLVNLTLRHDEIVTRGLDWGRKNPGIEWTYFPCDGGDMVHTADLGREEIAKGLEFVSEDVGTPLGSPWMLHWSKKHSTWYGVP